MSTIRQLLAEARTQIPASEARLLLVEASGHHAAWLVAHDDERLPDDITQRYADWVARRAAGEPVAYLIGWREFYGRRFGVAPGVLIPRPETELLVEQGLAAVKSKQQPKILDLGTGSGCIAITMALECPDACVWAIDFSAAALQIARANAQALGAAVHFVQADWAAPLKLGQFDLILSNPPYIAPNDPHLSLGDLRFEPPTALAASDAGLADLRRIVAAAPDLLQAEGWLLCEHGYDQAEAMRALLIKNGFDSHQFTDLSGILRVSGGAFRTLHQD